MSELSHFATALILPVAAGVCVARLLGYLGSKAISGERRYQWPTTTEREELLRSTYHRELATLEERSLDLPEPDSLRVIGSQRDHLEAMMRSLETVEPMALVARERHGAELAEARSNLGIIEESVKKRQVTGHTNKLVEQTDSLLRSLTLHAHTTLAEIEQEVTSELVTKTLGSMGYDLGHEGSTVVASTAETSIRVEVSPAGGVLLDTTSFSGLSCHRELARFEHTLRDEGVVLRRCLAEESKRRGGVLLTDLFPPLRTLQGHLTKRRAKARQKHPSPTEQEQRVYLMHRSRHKEAERIRVA
jgi:hypothetical protein